MTTHFKRLIDHIKELIPLTDSECTCVKESFKIKKLKRKEILLAAGDVSVYMRFVADGCLRTYSTDGKGREHILQFGIENWWVNDLYSYLTQTPAKYFIQAVKESVVLQIHRDSLEQLYKNVPAMERFFRIKIQNAYIAFQERGMNQVSRNAEERYYDFRTKHPEIEQRVPQYMIASYLGLTPEFLSSIRKNFSKKIS